MALPRHYRDAWTDRVDLTCAKPDDPAPGAAHLAKHRALEPIPVRLEKSAAAVAAKGKILSWKSRSQAASRS
jgi:hypothetical protein